MYWSPENPARGVPRSRYKHPVLSSRTQLDMCQLPVEISLFCCHMAASLSVTPSPSPSTPWYESQAMNMYCERDMTWFVVKSKWYLAWHLKMWTCQRCAWTLTVQRETTSQTTAERCFQPRRFDLHLLELHESSRSKSSVNSCHPSQSV